MYIFFLSYSFFLKMIVKSILDILNLSSNSFRKLINSSFISLTVIFFNNTFYTILWVSLSIFQSIRKNEKDRIFLKCLKLLIVNVPIVLDDHRKELLQKFERQRVVSKSACSSVHDVVRSCCTVDKCFLKPGLETMVSAWIYNKT